MRTNEPTTKLGISPSAEPTPFSRGLVARRNGSAEAVQAVRDSMLGVSERASTLVQSANVRPSMPETLNDHLPRPGRWTAGNRLHLLENGEQYYSAVLNAIESSQSEVLIETFILFSDEVGHALRAALIRAAQRGVKVVITVDGYGSPDLTPEFVGAMTACGIDFRYFDPRPRVCGRRTNSFKRLHRKLVIVDQKHAFVGGLNFSIEHLAAYGADAKQDYALQIYGPLVKHVHVLACALLNEQPMPPARPWWRGRAEQPPGHLKPGQGASAKLIWRDNHHHQDDIDIHYRHAIRRARHNVTIANAYFFPSYRIIRELRRAARRGVNVTLILQGRNDHALAAWAARALYTHLIQSGVRIFEYTRRRLHAKVAVIDGHWATVGSSNLDPTSLSLNLEANVVVDDAEFANALQKSLHTLLVKHCERVGPDTQHSQPAWRRMVGYLVFHLTRLIPAWSRILPVRYQPVASANLSTAEDGPSKDGAPHQLAGLSDNSTSSK
ncbi:MAG: cardiolipin synthase ClsB [Polycyclovorans sp.]|nr:cardiolipin synthase ClsB [Polycyclovorans sp.]